MKFCPECGDKIADNFTFCPSCGTDLHQLRDDIEETHILSEGSVEEPEQDISSEESTSEVEEESIEKNIGFGNIRIILALIFFVGCMILFFYFISPKLLELGSSKPLSNIQTPPPTTPTATSQPTSPASSTPTPQTTLTQNPENLVCWDIAHNSDVIIRQCNDGCQITEFRGQVTRKCSVPTPTPVNAGQTPTLQLPAGPTSSILSYRAVPLIFVPNNQLNTCSKYENVRATCGAYFTWPAYSFSYRGTGYPITIPINTGAYQAIKYNLSKMNDQRQRDINENKLGNYTYGGIGITVPLDEQAQYYSAIINDPAQEASYNYILNYLRKIRDQNHLDDNEYAELISLFVQRTFPYSTDPDRLIVKYPLETIGDKGGDCDDKSLLLAGLLSREGYGTALLWFPSGNHMMVGILGDHQATEYNGYLGIEATVDSYLGFYHAKDSIIIPWSMPTQYMADYKVIKISDGKPFTAGRELNFIWDQWVLFKGFASESEKYSEVQYSNDYLFIATHIDDRHMVYQYLTKTGIFT